MWSCLVSRMENDINPVNAKLNPICHLLALLGAHPILHISRIRVKIDNKSFKSVDGIVQIFGNNPNKAKLPL